MSYTEIKELIDWLKQLDEVTLLELLDINSETLVDNLTDYIVENQGKLQREYAKDQQDRVQE